MKLLHKYIGSSYCLTFLITLFVLSSVVSLGVIFKITDLLARGVSWKPVILIFLHGMPAAMTFAIPISALTASLLIFGRLSGDGEITAMKACGVSMWQVFSTPLGIAAVLTAVCMWISSEVAPRSEYARRVLVAELGAMSATDLLQEGRFIRDFRGYTIYIGKEDDGYVEDIRIYDLSGDERREIVAKSGRIRVSQDSANISMKLSDVRIEPYYGNKPAFLDSYTVVVPEALDVDKPRQRLVDKTIGELLYELWHLRSSHPTVSGADRLQLRTELLFRINKRLAVSVSSFFFVLLGAPLGVKAHRRESSIGVAISLGLVLVFYIFIIVAESLSEHPAAHPELIVWLPVLIAGILGTVLIQRTN
jgi:lipopolysaccharide export system permease protein